MALASARPVASRPPHAFALRPALPLGTCPPIADAEIVATARTMNLAGAGAAGGVRLLVALLDAAADLPDLTRQVQAQPGIAVRVMRVANSAYYGQSGQIATLDRAAQVLGLAALRGIAAAASFDRMTAPLVGHSALDLAAFRMHGLATACAARTLAQITIPELADEAFMAGLLHDLGIIVQWRLRQPWLTRHRTIAPAEGTPADPPSEAEAVGATHAHCGRRLLEAWLLPARLVGAVAGHGDAAEQTASAPLAALLTLADRVAADAGFGFDADSPPAPCCDAALAACGLAAADLPAAEAGLADAVQRLSEAFGDSGESA